MGNARKSLVLIRQALALDPDDPTVNYKTGEAYVFEAAGIRNIEITDRMKVADRIMELYALKIWERGWLVVDALYKAESATIIVSEDDSSEIVLKASAALPIGSLPLANSNLGLSMSSSTGRITHVIVQRDLAPLYSCLRIKDPIVGAASYQLGE